MIHIAICDDDIQLCNQLEDYIRKLEKRRKETGSRGIQHREGILRSLSRQRHFDLIFLYHHEGLQVGIELGRFPSREA